MSDTRDWGLDTARLRALAEQAQQVCCGKPIECGRDEYGDAIAACCNEPDSPVTIESVELLDLLAEIERLTRERDALKKPMQQHCPSCVDAQCWGTRQSPEARVAALEQENARLRETLKATTISAVRAQMKGQS